MAEVTKAMWNARKEVNWQTVIEMAEKIGVNAVLKRLGYLLSILDIEESISGSISEKIKKIPYHYLDPTAHKKRIENSKKYGLILNRTKDDLLGWMEH